MKIIVCFIVLISLINSNWNSEIEKTILEIDNNSTLKKSKRKDNNIIKFYKYKSYKKIDLISGKDFLFDTAHFEFYASKDSVFARKIFCIGKYLSKGATKNTDPIGLLEENIQIYKSENEGLQYSRSIDYYKNSNIDSLIFELKKTNYDTTKIGNEDYILVKKGYKILKKGNIK
jgi:hypothetical protein